MNKKNNKKSSTKAIEKIWGKGSCDGCSRTKNYKGNELGEKYPTTKKRS